jgi:hypothetical protein
MATVKIGGSGGGRKAVGFSTGGARDTSKSLTPNRGAKAAVNRGPGAAKRGAAGVKTSVNRSAAASPSAGAFSGGAVPTGDRS